MPADAPVVVNLLAARGNVDGVGAAAAAAAQQQQQRQPAVPVQPQPGGGDFIPQAKPAGFELVAYFFALLLACSGFAGSTPCFCWPKIVRLFATIVALAGHVRWKRIPPTDIDRRFKWGFFIAAAGSFACAVFFLDDGTPFFSRDTARVFLVCGFGGCFFAQRYMATGEGPLAVVPGAAAALDALEAGGGVAAVRGEALGILDEAATAQQV